MPSRRCSCLVLLLLPTLVRADVAVLEGGKRVTGVATLAKGKLVFTPKDRRVKVAADDLREIHLDGSPPSFRAGPAHRVQLAGKQSLSGVFLGMEKGEISLKTSWSDR